MQPRAILRALLLTGAVAFGIPACPNPTDAATAATQRSRTPSRIAVVAWKPRAWAPPAKPVPAAAAGLRVGRDPVDGTLIMPEVNELEPQVVIGERTPVAVTRRANGSIRAQLDDRFAEHAVARIGADGKPRWTCVSGPVGAEPRLETAPAAPARAPSPGTVWEDK